MKEGQRLGEKGSKKLYEGRDSQKGVEGLMWNGLLRQLNSIWFCNKGKPSSHEKFIFIAGDYIEKWTVFINFSINNFLI